MFQCAICAIENQLIIQRLSRQLVSENAETFLIGLRLHLAKIDV